MKLFYWAVCICLVKFSFSAGETVIMNIDGEFTKFDYDNDWIYFYFYSGEFWKSYDDESTNCKVLRIKRTKYIDEKVISGKIPLDKEYTIAEIANDETLKFYHDWNGDEIMIPIEGSYSLTPDGAGKAIEYKIKILLKENTSNEKARNRLSEKLTRVKRLLEKELQNDEMKKEFYIRNGKEEQLKILEGKIEISSKLMNVIEDI